MIVCGATTRSGGQCQQAAGWGTDHAGRGRCRLHGGASAGRPPIHGRYSLTHRAGLADKARRFAADPAPWDLAAEIALQRALLQTYLDRFHDKPMGLADIQAVFSMVDELGRMVERVSRILSETALTRAETRLLMAMLADLLIRYIPDAGQRAQFLDELAAALGDPHPPPPPPAAPAATRPGNF